MSSDELSSPGPRREATRAFRFKVPCDFAHTQRLSRRAAVLAEIVAAAYNSPGIIDGANPEGIENGPVHGRNAGIVAQLLHRWGLFRP